MSTIRELRRKIHSVDNIQKITQAMELVAASRLRKAQTIAESARRYAIKLQKMMDLLLGETEDLEHSLITTREIKKTALMIIAGDRGLCGAYNQNIFNAAERFLAKYQPNEVAIIPIGRKPLQYFETKKWPIIFNISQWGGKITYFEIKKLSNRLIDFYLNYELDEIWVLYTHFINMTLREIRIEKFLKIDIPSPSKDKTTIFEPDPLTILEEMLPHYCTIKIQTALNEAYISELSARISSMRAATKNAEEMLEKLTLKRNKMRQSGITKELIEITSSAESLR